MPTCANVPTIFGANVQTTCFLTNGSDRSAVSFDLSLRGQPVLLVRFRCDFQGASLPPASPLLSPMSPNKAASYCATTEALAALALRSSLGFPSRFPPFNGMGASVAMGTGAGGGGVGGLNLLEDALAVVPASPSITGTGAPLGILSIPCDIGAGIACGI